MTVATALDVMDLGAQEHLELRFGGFGGQGVILAGYIIGRAITVHAGRNAVMSQSYGPESRGGACMTEVVIDNGEIVNPRVADPDLVIVMSQPAYVKYAVDRGDALLIVDEDLVTLDDEAEAGRTVLKVPATRLAEELGRRIFANIVMLGFVSGATNAIEYEVLREAVAASVPRGTEEANLMALQTGFDYAKEHAA